MTSLHPTRRAAERFDALVEGDWHDAVDPKTAELLELVGAVRSVPAPAARPEFVADLRERLMLAAETELVVPKSTDDMSRRLTVAPRRTPRERRLAIALGGFAIVGATTSMAVAAQSALPGDALYPVKRAMENAEAGFRISDDAKGQTILANASGRLDEVDELTSTGAASASDIEQTLDAFSDQAAEAGDLLLADYENTGREDSISDLLNFTAESIDALSALEAVIPPEAEAALLNAAQVLFAIDAAAANACPQCGDGITEVPPQLLASGGKAIDNVAAGLAGSSTTTAAPAQSKPKPDKPAKDKPPVTDGGDGTVGVPPATAGPGGGTDTSQPDGVGVNVGQGGGKNDDKNKPPVDLSPVTDAVDEAVTGVGEVLEDTLGGLSGNKKNQG